MILGVKGAGRPSPTEPAAALGEGRHGLDAAASMGCTTAVSAAGGSVEEVYPAERDARLTSPLTGLPMRALAARCERPEVRATSSAVEDCARSDLSAPASDRESGAVAAGAGRKCRSSAEHRNRTGEATRPECRRPRPVAARGPAVAWSGASAASRRHSSSGRPPRIPDPAWVWGAADGPGWTCAQRPSVLRGGGRSRTGQRRERPGRA